MASRWKRLTAVAACAGLMCGAVGGDIIYYQPPAPISVPINLTPIELDLDFNGVIDLVLQSNGSDFTCQQQGNNEVLGIRPAPPDAGIYLDPLSLGTSIDATPTSPREWGGAPDTGVFASCQGEGCIGLWWGANADGFLGVRFDIDGDTHYGWVHIINTFSVSGEVYEWGYESTPDTAILAGAGMVPEPSTAFLLIAGGLGLVLQGRKRKRI